MEPEEEPPPPPPLSSQCTCPCHHHSYSTTPRKRKHGSNSDSSSSSSDDDDDDVTTVALIDIRNETSALREASCSRRRSILDLSSEIEEEREASATAASEAMSMILRLQREKAEAQMEFRQFKRFAEQKMSHDQEEIASLEMLLFNKDQAVHALSCQIQDYKQRLFSLGYGLEEDDSTAVSIITESSMPVTPLPSFDYPALRCKVRIADVDDNLEGSDDGLGETPRDQIQNIERRIARMERLPSSSQDKGVIGYSPHRPWHARKLSIGSYGSPFPVPVDRGYDRDDVCDRVYTIDAVHVARDDDYGSTPRECWNEGGEDEIKRLYMRMQALEADRESMRETILSLGTDKAQILLLKEIAQKLCKDGAPPPQKTIVTKSTFSFIKCLSLLTAIKWVVSFVFWRKKPSKVKYTFGISNNNNGLLLLLERSNWLRQRRCLMGSL